MDIYAFQKTSNTKKLSNFFQQGYMEKLPDSAQKTDCHDLKNFNKVFLV
jgi:hypothetical protein